MTSTDAVSVCTSARFRRDGADMSDKCTTCRDVFTYYRAQQLNAVIVYMDQESRTVGVKRDVTQCYACWRGR